MINKAMIWRKRRAGICPADFVHRVESKQAPLVARVPGVTRYIQSFTLPQAYARGEPAYDCVEELEFGSQRELEAAGQSPHWEAFIDDNRDLFNEASSLILAVEVHLAKSGRTNADMVKGMQLVNARENLSVDGFETYWHDVHGPIAARIPTLIRYEQNSTRQMASISSSTVYQGVAVTWFESTKTMKVGVDTPEYTALRADEPNLISATLAPYLITKETLSIRP